MKIKATIWALSIFLLIFPHSVEMERKVVFLAPETITFLPDDAVQLFDAVFNQNMDNERIKFPIEERDPVCVGRQLTDYKTLLAYNGARMAKCFGLSVSDFLDFFKENEKGKVQQQFVSEINRCGLSRHVLWEFNCYVEALYFFLQKAYLCVNPATNSIAQCKVKKLREPRRLCLSRTLYKLMKDIDCIQDHYDDC